MFWFCLYIMVGAFISGFYSAASRAVTKDKPSELDLLIVCVGWIPLIVYAIGFAIGKDKFPERKEG